MRVSVHEAGHLVAYTVLDVDPGRTAVITFVSDSSIDGYIDPWNSVVLAEDLLRFDMIATASGPVAEIMGGHQPDGLAISDFVALIEAGPYYHNDPLPERTGWASDLDRLHHWERSRMHAKGDPRKLASIGLDAERIQDTDWTELVAEAVNLIEKYWEVVEDASSRFVARLEQSVPPATIKVSHSEILPAIRAIDDVI